jgi:hypothetical protein
MCATEKSFLETGRPRPVLARRGRRGSNVSSHREANQQFGRAPESLVRPRQRTTLVGNHPSVFGSVASRARILRVASSTEA